MKRKKYKGKVTNIFIIQTNTADKYNRNLLGVTNHEEQKIHFFSGKAIFSNH